MGISAGTSTGSLYRTTTGAERAKSGLFKLAPSGCPSRFLSSSFVMCDLHYSKISLSEIRSETAPLKHRGAETAWSVYEKAEFGVLDEGTPHLKDKYH